MGGILSAISGQFTRSLILGAFFPVVLFLVLGLLTVQPLLPQGIPIVHLFQSFDPQWQALTVTFVAVVLAGMLYNLNTPIVRLYEGYPWRESWIGKFKIQKLRNEFEHSSLLISRLRVVRNAIRDFPAKAATVELLQSDIDRIDQKLNSQFPSHAGIILPTRFGNVVRSFETYPTKQYGMDGVTLWPRIVVVAPKELIEAAADARSTVDFFINGSLLSAILAFLLTAVGLWKTGDRLPPSTLFLWPIESCAAALCSYLFYAGATTRAIAWGSLVKTAFDLHRFDLLKRLGYTDEPSTRAEERQLWWAISQQIMYGDPPVLAPKPYKPPVAPRLTITATPPDIPLELSTGVNPLPFQSGLSRSPMLRRTYTLRHAAPGGLSASAVVVSETLGPQESYVWNSGRVAGQPQNPGGTNPISFNLGPLGAGNTVEFSYIYLVAEVNNGRAEEARG